MMKKNRSKVFIILLLIIVSGCDDKSVDAFQVPSDLILDENLQIQPVQQSLTQWCWLASGEMVFRYYNIPSVNLVNYQCGIIAMMSGINSPCWLNCSLCNVAAPNIAHIYSMVVNYPQLANLYYGGGVSQLQANYRTSPLNDDEMIAQLEQGMPIIVGVSTSGFRFPGQVSEHAIIVIGYGIDQDEVFFLVNDPWPYNNFSGQNPYIAGGGIQTIPGQYLISSSAFRNRLVLREAVFNISYSDR